MIPTFHLTSEIHWPNSLSEQTFGANTVDMEERVLAMESEPVFKQIVGWVDSFDQPVQVYGNGGLALIKFEGMYQVSHQLTRSGCRQKWIDDRHV